jgi:hypothetical protein
MNILVKKYWFYLKLPNTCFTDQTIIFFMMFQGSVSVSTFDFENFDYTIMYPMSLKRWIWAYDSFYSGMLPAVTQMTNSPTQEIHMN